MFALGSQNYKHNFENKLKERVIENCLQDDLHRVSEEV